ncbi:MAG: YqiA/YcfP family alpha/beta fold hydrolase [Pelovirga sp.]
MKLLFLHGLESGPRGSKCQALEQVFGEVLAPDCSGIADEQQRLAVIRRQISGATLPFLVVGSSMGGLLALLLHQALPQAVAGLVLCAPALHRDAANTLDLDSLPPTRVIHGRADRVVPLAVSYPFGDRLLVVDDDHRLGNSLPVILQAVFDLKLELAGLLRKP